MRNIKAIRKIGGRAVEVVMLRQLKNGNCLIKDENGISEIKADRLWAADGKSKLFFKEQVTEKYLFIVNNGYFERIIHQEGYSNDEVFIGYCKDEDGLEISSIIHKEDDKIGNYNDESCITRYYSISGNKIAISVE